MSEILRLNRYLSGSLSFEKQDVLRRAKLLKSYSDNEIRDRLEIQKGYCMIKSKDCTDFTDCQGDCWFCNNHILNIQKYPEVITELRKTSDNLENIIDQQIELLKSIYKDIFYEASTEHQAGEESKKLKSVSNELKRSMDQKIIIDSHLLDYILED